MATVKNATAKKSATAKTKATPAKVSKTTTKTKSVKVEPTTTKKVVKKKKSQEATLDTKNVKETVKKIVTSEREVKYNYPEEVDNPLDKKAWRAKVRSKLRQYESKILKEKDEKEKSKLEKAYNNYRKEVLLVP